MKVVKTNSATNPHCNSRLKEKCVVISQSKLEQTYDELDVVCLQQLRQLGLAPADLCDPEVKNKRYGKLMDG